MSKYRLLFFLLVHLGSFLSAGAEQVPVRHKEGLVHGFLVLQVPGGGIIADGDLLQNARGDRVTSRLVFRFKDGSLHDETAVFSERGRFRLLRHHLVQKGPAFAHPMEATLDATSGRVTVRYTEGGKEKTVSEHQNLPADIANGMILTLLKNIRPDTPETKVSWMAYTPRPRLVKLAITPHGEDRFSTGHAARKALRYVVKVEIGGVSGLLADLLGKEPPDIHVWVLQGEAPAFVRSEGPLASGGPVWRIALSSPEWPNADAAESKDERHK